MLSYAKNLIPDICEQHLNNLELNKCQISMRMNFMSLFLGNANIFYYNIIFT